jgi:hypothetical protein
MSHGLAEPDGRRSERAGDLEGVVASSEFGWDPYATTSTQLCFWTWVPHRRVAPRAPPGDDTVPSRVKKSVLYRRRRMCDSSNNRQPAPELKRGPSFGFALPGQYHHKGVEPE